MGILTVVLMAGGDSNRCDHGSVGDSESCDHGMAGILTVVLMADW